MWPALFAAVAALVLTGCGGAAEQSAVAPAADAGAARGDSLAARPEAAGGGADESAASALAEADGQAKGADQRVNVRPEDRQIVYTAELTVRAKDVAAAAEQAKRLVLAAGGYVADERSDSYDGGDSRAVLVLKVPPDRYPAVLGQLGKDLGTRLSLHQGTEDVTEEVADVAARVKSAEAALNQMRTLLSKAEKIGEVLEIEREISQRTAELEALQARQKALAARTAMATVTLNLVGPTATPPPDDDEPSGFLGGLATGWDSLVAAAKVGLTVLGVLLPWLVVLAVVAFAVRLLLRRLRPRPAAPPAPPAVGAPDPDAPAQDPVGASSGHSSTP